MSYFDSDKKKSSLGTFKVSGARVVTFNSGEGFAFGITPQVQMALSGPEITRQYMCMANAEADRKKWIDMLVLHGAVDDGVTQDGVAHQSLLLEGWLEKRGGVWKSLQKRYFVLLPSNLQYFKEKPKSLSDEPAGTIPLTQLSSVRKDPTDSIPFTFLVQSSSDSKRVYEINGKDDADISVWVAAISKAISDLQNDSTRDSEGSCADTRSRASMDSTQDAATLRKEGVLLKKGKKGNTYKKRYFILDFAGHLVYWDSKPKNPNDKSSILGTVIISSHTVVQVDEASLMFAITSSNLKSDSDRKFFLMAGNKNELTSWVSALSAIIDLHVRTSSSRHGSVATIGTMDLDPVPRNSTSQNSSVAATEGHIDPVPRTSSSQNSSVATVANIDPDRVSERKSDGGEDRSDIADQEEVTRKVNVQRASVFGGFSYGPINLGSLSVSRLTPRAQGGPKPPSLPPPAHLRNVEE